MAYTKEERKEYSKKWRERNPEKVKAWSLEAITKYRVRRLAAVRAWYHRHKDAINAKRRADRIPKEWAKKMKAYAQANPEKMQGYRRKHNYGMTAEQFNSMIVSQNNSCGICFEIFSQTPHVDHCHSSGKVRGLLCRKCNTGIGYFKENVDIFESARNYILKHNKDKEK